MSIGTELYTIMNADASINAAFSTGGVYYENLPDNFDLKDKWLLYYFRKTSQMDVMTTKSAYDIYDLEVTILVQNTADVVSNTDLITTYLNGIESGGIIDIRFDDDGHSFDKEKGIYTNTMTFEIIYV